MELPLRTLFENPTVRGLAAALRNCETTETMPSMVRAEETRFDESQEDGFGEQDLNDEDDNWEEGEL